jgi:uncharacterized protein (TIGR03437 family)
LGVSILGSAIIAPGGVRAYGSSPTYLALDIQFGLGAPPGPLHFVFSKGSGVYVLPKGVTEVHDAPPSIDSATTDENGTITITGSHFAADSRVYVDGLAASTNVLDDSHATAVPPPGAAKQQATVVMVNSDGQNSTFLNPDTPPVYTYPDAPAPKITISPNALPAGARAMIDVSGENTNFVDGLVTVGLGSSDVLVRRVWVLSPTHVLISVSVAANARPGASLLSVLSGFQMFTQPAGFQVLPARQNFPVVEPTLINGVWQPSGVFPGAIASLFGTNLGGAATKITISNLPVTILYASATQINLVIPGSLKPGPAILRLNNGVDDAYPVVISIDRTPPAITAVQTSAGINIDAGHTPLPGDSVNVMVAGLADNGTKIDPARVHVNAGGTDIPAATVDGLPNRIFQVTVKLPASVSTGPQIPVTVSIDGKTSLPFYIAIQAPPAAASPSGN